MSGREEEIGIGNSDGEKGLVEKAVEAAEVVEGGRIEEVGPAAADEGERGEGGGWDSGEAV